MKFQGVNFDKIVTSKLIEAKTNSKYLTGYLDKVIRPKRRCLKEVDMLRHLKLKMEIKIKTINLSIQMRTSYQKNIKLFGLRLKT